MNWNLLSDVNSQALVAALRGTAARHTAIANNVANVDTPGFIRADVEFQEALAAALDFARRAPNHDCRGLQTLSLRPTKDTSAPARADGNNVDIDREMAVLARNALSYQAAIETLSARIRMLRTAIKQGRR